MKKTWLAVALACGTLSLNAVADVSINGFASVKAGTALGSDDVKDGYTDEISFNNESLFAVQFQSDLGDKLSVTAQVMARGNNDYNANFEWAFITYQATEAWRFNAGRLRTPFYKYSDFRDVGYAYDWLRTPQSVYSLGFDTIEGVSAYHNGSIGELNSTLQLVFGAYDGQYRVAGVLSPTQINEIKGITWEVGQDWLTLRLAYLNGKVSVTSDALTPLLTGLNQAGLGSVARAIDFNEENGTFFGAGLSFDRNNWVAVTEFTKVTVDDSFYGDQKSFYASLGYRFGAVTPYVSYEIDDDKAKTFIYSGLPANLPVRTVIAGVVDSQEWDHKTVNVGLRYDFHPSAAFKVQYSSSDDNTDNLTPSNIAVGVDVVF